MNPLAHQLKKLATIDQEIVQIRSSEAELHTQMTEIGAVIAALDDQIKQLEIACAQAKRNVAAQELESEVLRERETTTRKSIDVTHSHKEYTSLQREIDFVARQRYEHEDTLIRAYHDLEALEKKLAKERILRDEKVAMHNQKKAETTAALAEFTEKISALTNARAEQASQIPAEWIQRYDRMSSRVKDPIVPLINGSCSACFYSIVPHELARLKKGEILTCRNCYRFLYEDSKESKEAAEATY